MKRSTLFSTLITAAALAFTATPSSAAPILGSNVDSALFSSAIGSSSGWSYIGQSTGSFSGDGTASVVYRDSSANNSFGFSRTNHTGMTTVFNNGAGVGSTSNITTGYTPSYLFYFQSVYGISFLDSNTQYTDGFDTGGLLQGQGGIDIFHNAALNTWAMFFDDGGPAGLGDDNDYNDLVVTFAQATASVPEPASLSLLGLSLLGLGYMRRRKHQA